MLTVAARMVLLAAMTVLSGRCRVAQPVACRLMVRRLRTTTAMNAIVGGPRVLLTSAGLSTPALEGSFRRMMLRTSADGMTPKIAMLVTAQMAPGLSGQKEAVREGEGKKRSPGELRRRRWADARIAH
mmetsp:Transcript_28919/g.58201  ORF Transcript_28919/g.58201 Transcript_28919/m.58201 type:complete len:128 (+) Transcript_28919:24-407(+)